MSRGKFRLAKQKKKKEKLYNSLSQLSISLSLSHSLSLCRYTFLCLIACVSLWVHQDMESGSSVEKLGVRKFLNLMSRFEFFALFFQSFFFSSICFPLFLETFLFGFIFHISKSLSLFFSFISFNPSHLPQLLISFCSSFLHFFHPLFLIVLHSLFLTHPSFSNKDSNPKIQVY